MYSSFGKLGSRTTAEKRPVSSQLSYPDAIANGRCGATVRAQRCHARWLNSADSGRSRGHNRLAQVDPKPPFAARETSAARVQVFGPLVRKTASGLLHLQKKPTHAFSSRLSSFRKRQSVFSAMIFCGVDLMKPTSRSRSA